MTLARRSRTGSRTASSTPASPTSTTSRSTHVDTLPLWREHYLLVTAAGGELGEATRPLGATRRELPLCLLTPDMQHRRIVDGAFARAGATPAPGGRDELGRPR